jgi:hypothetical protein
VGRDGGTTAVLLHRQRSFSFALFILRPSLAPARVAPSCDEWPASRQQWNTAMLGEMCANCDPLGRTVRDNKSNKGRRQLLNRLTNRWSLLPQPLLGHYFKAASCRAANVQQIKGLTQMDACYCRRCAIAAPLCCWPIVLARCFHFITSSKVPLRGRSIVSSQLHVLCEALITRGVARKISFVEREHPNEGQTTLPNGAHPLAFTTEQPVESCIVVDCFH